MSGGADLQCLVCKAARLQTIQHDLGKDVDMAPQASWEDPQIRAPQLWTLALLPSATETIASAGSP